MNQDPSRRTSWLETKGPRVAALLCFFGSAGLLTYLHRDDIWPPPAEEGGANTAAFAACTEQRYGKIDNMRKENLIDDAQLAKFRARAEAICWDTTSKAE